MKTNADMVLLPVGHQIENHLSEDNTENAHASQRGYDKHLQRF